MKRYGSRLTLGGLDPYGFFFLYIYIYIYIYICVCTYTHQRARAAPDHGVPGARRAPPPGRPPRQKGPRTGPRSRASDDIEIEYVMSDVSIVC